MSYPNYPNYVLHVKKGYKDREESIIRQFRELDAPFEWVLDYDTADIDGNTLKKYSYNGNLKKTEISCSLKHISTWEKIAGGDRWAAFVFEDDVIIDPAQFNTVVEKALEEFQSDWNCDAIISLGDAGAMHAPWTKMKDKKKLYSAELIRCSDSYLITKGAAQKLMEWIKVNGFSLSADRLIDRICNECGVMILWLEPTVVSQGTHTGLFPSAIQGQGRTGGIFNKIEWYARVLRRKYFYPVFGIDLRKKG